MRNTVESEKIAEIKKLLEIAYVETMYESLSEPARYIKAAVESLTFDARPPEEPKKSGIVLEFSPRKPT